MNEEDAFEDEMLNEFKTEAEETLVDAENSLMALEDGEAYDLHYVPIFRAFHNIKGASGMFALTEINDLFHHLETVLFITKDYNAITESICAYLLRGIDEARNLFNAQKPTFEMLDPKEVTKELSGTSSATSVSNETPTVDPTATNIAAPAAVEPTKLNSEVIASNVPPTVPVTTSVNQTVSSTNADSDLFIGEVFAVDDEETILSLIKDTLVDAGFKVTTFNRAEDLISQLKTQKPDVILSDIKMPKMKGTEMLVKVREIDPEIPLVFLSGHLSIEHCIDALANGAFAFVEKPFDEGQLISILRNAIQKHKAMKLIRRSINFIMYQFPELDEFLKEQGQDKLRESLNIELKEIVSQRQKLLKVA